MDSTAFVHIPDTSRRILHLPVQEAYDRWSEIYDTDGNILQALDDFNIRSSLLPQLMKLSNSDRDGLNTINATDLGCGTGRGSLALLDISKSHGIQYINLACLDTSSGMLDRARNRLAAVGPHGHKIQFKQWDMLDQEWEEALLQESTSTQLPFPEADILISTLVLEHVPLRTFFLTIAALLKPGGHSMVTNMHADMGNTPAKFRDDSDEQQRLAIATGAGFNEPSTNTKIRVAMDYAYTIEETLRAAKEAGLSVIGEVKEQVVEPWLVEGETPLLGERGKKWIGIKCWYGIIFKKAST